MFRHNVQVVLGLISLLAIADSQARDWQTLYAFGDSYTDSGAGYVDGNGPTAVVYLTESLGIPFTHAADTNAAGKGLNFAVSGARTGSGDGMKIRPGSESCGSKEAWMGRGMQTQVRDFVERVKTDRTRFDPEKTVFFIAGGLNDRPLPAETSIENLKTQIRMLHDAGARYFWVALLPTKIPAFTEMGLRLNPRITKIPQEMRTALPTAHIEVSHWGNFLDLVMDQPAKYGIKNTQDKCAGRALFGEDSTPCSAPDTYYYYHEGHPSTAVQKIVAQEMKRELAAAFK